MRLRGKQEPSPRNPKLCACARARARSRRIIMSVMCERVRFALLRPVATLRGLSVEVMEYWRKKKDRRKKSSGNRRSAKSGVCIGDIVNSNISRTICSACLEEINAYPRHLFEETHPGKSSI